MIVRMLQKIGGTRNGLEWPDKDGLIELPDHEARDLVAAGLAAYARSAGGGSDPTPAPVEVEPDDESTPAAPKPPRNRNRNRTPKAGA